MHRQSLGSPSGKLQLHVNGVVICKETSPLSSSSSSPSSSSSELLKNHTNHDEDEKSLKKSQKTTPSRHPEKFIHLIPVLTLFCILVLYLSSHNPSQNELAQFNGFQTWSDSTDSTANMDEIQVLEIGKGDVLAIRNARNLQGLDKEISKSRLHRKIGDF